MKKFLVWLLVWMLVLPCAAAETAVVSRGLQLGQGAVYYPQVEGMADEALEDAVNAALVKTLGVEELLNRLSLTMHSQVPLLADFTWQLEGEILSVALKATGPVTNDRATQVWYAVNVDLTDGHIIGLEELFTDAALTAIADKLEWELAPELSAHLRHAQLTPLPEQFTLNAAGVTWYYPLEQLSTLGDQAGTVNLQWCEMMEQLRLGEGSILRRLGAEAMVTLDEGSLTNIRTAAESGALPGIPARLGDSVQEMVEKFRLLADPDLYDNGRMIQLEDGAFRSVYLLTDRLTDSWENSVIQGIRADRINLYGLCTGMTTQEEWRQVLGQPQAAVTVDAALAEAQRLLPGSSDYYDFDGVQLRLHAGEDGTLASLFMSMKPD